MHSILATSKELNACWSFLVFTFDDLYQSLVLFVAFIYDDPYRFRFPDLDEEWTHIGTFHALNHRDIQQFPLNNEEHVYAKFIKVSYR